MAAIDFSRFHELAERNRGKIPLKKICEREGVSYRRYSYWRRRMGISPRRVQGGNPVMPEGMIEVKPEGVQSSAGPLPKAKSVRIVFENGLKLERQGMDVDTLVEFLTKIRSVLCLG